jgi:hypothetical protein
MTGQGKGAFAGRLYGEQFQTVAVSRALLDIFIHKEGRKT